MAAVGAAGGLHPELQGWSEALAERARLVESDIFRQAVGAAGELRGWGGKGACQIKMEGRSVPPRPAACEPPSNPNSAPPTARAGLEWLTVRRQVAKRQLTARLPPVLFLQLRRAFWTPSGHQVKVSGRVRFPLLLRPEALGLPALGGQPPAAAPPEGGAAGLWAGSGGGSGGAGGAAAAEEAEQPRGAPLRPLPPYRLRAVVQHFGGTASGHYLVYRALDAELQRWACVSDEDVQQAVPVQRVLSAEATALVYERSEGK